MTKKGKGAKKAKGRGKKNKNKTRAKNKVTKRGRNKNKQLKMKGAGKKNRRGRGQKKGRVVSSNNNRSMETVKRKGRASATVPQPVLGRIYFGSGVWGGGGGGKDGGNERQVGADRATSDARANRSIMRTTCNPKFRFSSDYHPRRSIQGPHSPFSPPSLSSSSPASASSYQHMKGGAIGAIFSSIFRTLVPVFKGLFRVGSTAMKSPVGQTIKQETIKSGLNAGINVVGDALRGKNVLESGKARIKEQAAQLPSNIERAMKKSRSKTIRMNNPPKAINRGRSRARPSLKRGITGVPIYKQQSPKSRRLEPKSRKNKKDLFNSL